MARKYYWPTLRHDVEAYVKGCDICLASKVVCYKAYEDLQFLLVLTYRWKHFLMNFVKNFSMSSDWKSETYNSILVIINRLTKIVHYKPVKITIDASGLVEVIIDMIVRHHSLSDSIITNRKSVFTSKFWSFLCYSLSIKRRLSTTFYLQTDGQTKR